MIPPNGERGIIESMTGIFGQSLDLPLHGSFRFLLATAGAMTFFGFGMFVLLLETQEEAEFISPFMLTLVFFLILPSLFGILISLPITKFSHTTFYLQGVIVPAVVLNVSKFTWLFWGN